MVQTTFFIKVEIYEIIKKQLKFHFAPDAWGQVKYAMEQIETLFCFKDIGLCSNQCPTRHVKSR